jgi:hypothetical protein
MKNLLICALTLFSFSALAFINEVECEWRHNEKFITADVERPFPANSTFKRMLVNVQNDNVAERFSYSVTSRRLNGFNEIQYLGGGVRLVVDLWPDNIPRWGRHYRGTLQSSDIQSSSISGFNCRFPNAQ